MKTTKGLVVAASIAALLAPAGGGWSQTPAAAARPAIPQFPPPPNFAGVAGTAAENTRIAALCGPNRNTQDGYAPAPAFPGQTKAPIVTGTQGYAVESVAKIDRPWSMAFLPSGKILVSFRNGGLRTVDKAGVVSDLLAGGPQIASPRLGSGMYAVILDRNFAKTRTVYLAWHTRNAADAAAMGRVGSARLSADEKSLTDLKVLREGADIQPRAIAQARDGKLFIASASLADASPDAQNLKSQLGKILRINADGSIPKDNPYASDPEANPAIWSRGFRDIHSVTIHPKTGELWAAENVPRGGDEIDIMRKGKNYGFATISYGRQNNGAWINGGKTAEAGMEQPLYYWNPSIAPAGMMFYTGKAFPGWKDNLFVGGMSGMQVTRLILNGEKVVGEEKLLMDRCLRFKHIEQASDGNIYLLTDQMPPAQNEILRLVPAPGVPAPRMPKPQPVAEVTTPPPAAAPAGATPEELALGATAYGRICAGCHGPVGAGVIGPAIAGRTDASVVADIIKGGQGSMPALGGALNASEIDAITKHIARLGK